MLTYEELAPVLWYYAYDFAKKSHYRYTPSELVAECWLKEKCQNLPDIKMAHMRIRNDMIDYMRSSEGKRRKRQPKYISIELLRPYDPVTQDEHGLDVIDEVRHIMCKHLTQTDRRICKLLTAGKTKKEIARLMNLCPGNLVYRVRLMKRLFLEHLQLSGALRQPRRTQTREQSRTRTSLDTPLP